MGAADHMSLPPIVGRLVGEDSHFRSTMRGATGAVAALGGAFAAVQVGGFFKDAVMGASDLAETMSKVDTVFGDAQKQVTGFANQMAKDFGLPKREILDAASSIGLIGKASGLSQADAAKMSTQLGKLAADASSFYNVPLPEALQAIQSGLVGEAEPMRRFGVLLNAQAVDAEAARLGLEKVGKEYTEGAKAQARASLIMSGMKDASGDLEKTQGSLSNRIRELKGRFQNFTTELGSRAIPAIQGLLDAGERLGARLAPVFDTIGGAARQFFMIFAKRDFVGGPFAEDAPFINGLFKVRDAIVGLLPHIQKFGAFVRENIGRIMAGVGAVILAVVVPALVSLVAGVVAAAAPFVALAALVAFVWPKIKDHVLGAVTAIVGFFQQQWPRIQQIVSEVMQTVASVISGVVDVILAVWNNFGSQIVSQLKAAWTLVMNIVDAAMNVIRGVIDVVAGLITGDWSRVWEGIKGIFSGVWDAIMAIVEYAITTIRNVISVAWEIIRGVFSGALDAIRDAVAAGIGAVVDLIASLPGRALSALGSLGSLLFDAGRRLLMGFVDGIVSVIGTVKDTLTGLVGKLTSWKGPPAKDARLLFGAGQLVMGGFDAGLQDGIPGVKSTLSGLTSMMGSPSMGAGSPHMGGGGAGGTTIVLVIGDKEFARVMAPANRDALIDLGRHLPGGAFGAAA